MKGKLTGVFPDATQSGEEEAVAAAEEDWAQGRAETNYQAIKGARGSHVCLFVRSRISPEGHDLGTVNTTSRYHL